MAKFCPTQQQQYLKRNVLISGAIGDISVEYNLKAPASCDPGKIISDNDTLFKHSKSFIHVLPEQFPTDHGGDLLLMAEYWFIIVLINTFPSLQ